LTRARPARAEIVFIEIDAAAGRNEPDYEIRQLLKASAGMNLALDYLPGSTMFDPAARDSAPAAEASLGCGSTPSPKTWTVRRRMPICCCGIEALPHRPWRSAVLSPRLALLAEED